MARKRGSKAKARFLSLFLMAVRACAREASGFHYVIFHQRSRGFIVLRQSGEFEKVPGLWPTDEKAAWNLAAQLEAND